MSKAHLEKAPLTVSSGDPSDLPSSSEPNPKPNIQTSQCGIWTVKVEKQPTWLSQLTQPSLLAGNLRSFKLTVSMVYRFLHKVYTVAPVHLPIYLLTQVVESLDDVVVLYLSTRVLKAIEEGLRSGKMDVKNIVTAVVARHVVIGAGAHLAWFGQRIIDQLRSRVKRFYELYMMKSNLSMDLPTSQSATSQNGDGTAEQAWKTFEDLVWFCKGVLKVVSQGVFTAGLAAGATPLFGGGKRGGGEGGSKTFLALSLMQPLFRAGWGDEIWNKVFLAVASNLHYQRMKVLERFASGTYRQDIISGGLQDWILDQYEQASNSLGSASDDHVIHQYMRARSPWIETITGLLGELPMTYCVIMAPPPIPILNRHFRNGPTNSSRLYSSMHLSIIGFSRFSQNVQSLKKLYERGNIVNSVVDGKIEYPRRVSESSQPKSELDEVKSDSDYDLTEANKGMRFDLENVSFSYPGSQTLSPALGSISLSIHAGDLVLIVGANGSGKSTLVRLLSRLYDPTSGTLLIDGLPSNAYTLASLHAASAILSQETLIYPLPLGENIGLGHPSHVADRDMIIQSAKEGGAWDVLSKFNYSGLDTVLDGRPESFHLNLVDKPEHPLFGEMTRLPKNVEVSGGEKQRIVASRTFMRFRSGLVKFVAVDEPSSALDAEGELALFQKLIELRQGKTVIFVTHRFGHLVKLADNIVCMKEGSIVEMGKHDVLMGIQGEYAKLYDIQASAYSNDNAE